MEPPRRPSPLHLLLSVALVWGLSGTSGQASSDCPEIVGQLGAGVVLPLSQGGTRSIGNASVHVLVTATNSSGSMKRRKLVSVYLPKEHFQLPLGHRYRLQRDPWGLEIPQSRRDDELWYSVSLEWNVTVEQFCRHLRLYEQVSALEIRVLNHTQDDGNGNCSVTLACLAAQGDNVTYSWSLGTGGTPLGTASGSQLLHLVLGPQETDHVYVCTARNPVSWQTRTFQPGPLCSRPPETRWWSLYAALLLLLFLVIIIIMLAVLVARRGKAEPSQPAEKTPGLTIYAQVQRTDSLHRTEANPEPQEDPCTTIYVAASVPASESAQPVPVPACCPPGPSYYNTVTAES